MTDKAPRSSKDGPLVWDGLWAEVEHQIRELEWYASRKKDLRDPMWCTHFTSDIRELREAIDTARKANVVTPETGCAASQREPTATALLNAYWSKLAAELPDVYEYLRLVTVSVGKPFEFPGMRFIPPAANAAACRCDNEDPYVCGQAKPQEHEPCYCACHKL
jgi:hypothetical protein